MSGNEGLELATMDVQVNGSASDPVVSATVYRTFKDGTSIDRDIYFLYEDGEWKHRFGPRRQRGSSGYSSPS